MEIIRELSLVVDTDAQCNTLQKALLLDLKYGVQKMFTGNTVDRLVYKAQVIKTADYALQHFTDHCIYPKLVNLFNLVENF
jgi:hypothetical protein